MIGGSAAKAIKVVVLGDASGLNKAAGEAERSISGIAGASETAGGRTTGALGGVRTMIGSMGAIWGSAKIAEGMFGAANAASDLGEAVNANNVIFKEGSGIIDAFAKGAINTVGLAEVTVRGLAAGVGGMFTAVGFEGKQAAGMTEELIKRAVDVGSVFNESADVVTQAFGSALRGEAEPARRFGVFLNADALAAEAMSSGLVKATVDVTKLKDAQLDSEKAQSAYNKAVKEHGPNSMQAREASVALEQAQGRVNKALEGSKTELTDAQKMQAAYQLVMRQTSQAQGDYANTSDSAANAQRRAKEAALEAKASLGESLAPILAEVSSLVAKVAGAFTELPGPVRTGVAALLGLAVVAGPLGSLVNLFGMLVPKAAASAAASTTAGTAAAASSGGFFAMAAGVWATLAPILAVIAAVAAIAGVVYIVIRNWDTIKEATGAAWNWILEHIRGIIQVLMVVILGPIGAIAVAIWKNWDSIKEAAASLWAFVVEKWNQLIGFLTGIPGRVAGALGDLWRGARDQASAIRGWVADRWNDLMGFLSGIPGRVAGMLGDLFGFLRGAAARGVQGARDSLGELVGFAGSIPGRIADAVGDLGRVLFNAGRRVIQGLIDGIRNALGGLGDVLGGVTKFIADKKGPPSYDAVMLKPHGRLIMGGLMHGIQSELPSLAATLGLVTNAIAGGVGLPDNGQLRGVGGRGGAGGISVQIAPGAVTLQFNGAVDEAAVPGIKDAVSEGLDQFGDRIVGELRRRFGEGR